MVWKISRGGGGVNVVKIEKKWGENFKLFIKLSLIKNVKKKKKKIEFSKEKSVESRKIKLKSTVNSYKKHASSMDVFVCVS